MNLTTEKRFVPQVLRAEVADGALQLALLHIAAPEALPLFAIDLDEERIGALRLRPVDVPELVGCDRHQCDRALGTDVGLGLVLEDERRGADGGDEVQDWGLVKDQCIDVGRAGVSSQKARVVRGRRYEGELNGRPGCSTPGTPGTPGHQDVRPDHNTGWPVPSSSRPPRQRNLLQGTHRAPTKVSPSQCPAGPVAPPFRPLLSLFF